MGGFFKGGRRPQPYSKIAAIRLISPRDLHFASKLPGLQHLLWPPKLNASILPFILHPIYSLADFFYAIIRADGLTEKKSNDRMLCLMESKAEK